MGASGYKPEEADETETAMISILTQSTAKNIKQKLLKDLSSRDSYNFSTIRYIAYVIGKMSQAGLIKDKDLFQAAKAVYEFILADKNYLNEWQEPAKLKRELKKEYAMFQKH